MSTSMKEDHDLIAAMTYRRMVEDAPAIENARRTREAEKLAEASSTPNHPTSTNKRIRKKASTRQLRQKR